MTLLNMISNVLPLFLFFIYKIQYNIVVSSVHNVQLMLALCQKGVRIYNRKFFVIVI